MQGRMIVAVRWLLGLQFLLSGCNWFIKMLPFPNMHDDRSAMPLKYQIVAYMIGTGWMFQLAKIVEVLAGLALVFNRWVPLMLCASMSVTVTTFFMDAWNVTPFVNWLRGTASFEAAWKYLFDALFFGGCVLVMQGYLMLNYLHVYRPMLQARVEAHPAQAAGGARTAPGGLMTLLGVLAVIFGVASTGWLIGMVHQWLIPWSSFAIFLQPRG